MENLAVVDKEVTGVYYGYLCPVANLYAYATWSCPRR